MLGCCSIVSCCMLSSIVLLIAALCHSCLACHLQTVHPNPVIFISISTEIISSFQRHTWFAKLMHCSYFPSGARICIAYHISHIMSCIASCCLWIAPWFIVVPLLVFLPWVEPGDEYVHEEPVEYANEDQAFDNSENLCRQDDHTFGITSIFALLVARSIAMLALPATVYHASLLPCQTSNHPVLANRCLAMSPLLLSPSYSIAGEDEVCSWLEHGYFGISQYLLFN